METSTGQLSAIDKALAAARARKANKETSGDTTISPNENRDFKTAEREARAAKRAADREALVADRQRRREARAAANQRTDVHMKKVQTARSKLPNLSDTSRDIFERATTNLDRVQLEALAQHLQFHNRLQSTINAPAKPIPVGTTVRIVSGDHRYIGLTGKISRSQKLRSHVSVPDRPREVYLFTSDLEVVGSE